MAFPRRSCALVTVLALLLSVAPAPRRHCGECPADCPMHAVRAEGPSDDAAPHVGCHRTPGVPTGALSLRAWCGGGAPAEAGAFPPAVLAPVRTATPVVAGARVAAPPASFATLPAPEPPVEPPRSPRA